MRSEPHTLLDGPADGVVGVTLRHRPEAVVEVEHLVPVHVPDAGALAALEVDRPGLAKLVGRGHAPGKSEAGPLVHLARSRRALVQRTRLALGQLSDAGAVYACGRDCHAMSLPLSLRAGGTGSSDERPVRSLGDRGLAEESLDLGEEVGHGLHLVLGPEGEPLRSGGSLEREHDRSLARIVADGAASSRTIPACALAASIRSSTCRRSGIASKEETSSAIIFVSPSCLWSTRPFTTSTRSGHETARVEAA